MSFCFGLQLLSSFVVNHCPNIKFVVKNRNNETVDKYAYRASLEEIRENDFNLNIPRYVDTFEEEKEIDIKTVQREIAEIENQLVETREEMAKYLKELGI